MKIKEIWKNIEGYKGLYQVSNLSRVKSLKRKDELILKPFVTKKGYNHVLLYKKGIKPKGHSLHRLVARAFIPNPDNKICINHINSNPNDNRLKNLEWCTHSENNFHAYKYGNKDKKGIKHHHCKLQEKEVMAIFNSNKSYRELCNIYPVNINTIKCIKSGKNWNHLTGKEYDPNKRKIKQEDVVTIFNSEISNKELANLYGVDASTISNIKTGKNFSWLTGKIFKSKYD